MRYMYIIAVVVLFVGCGEYDNKESKKDKTPKVTLIQPTIKTITKTTKYTGTIEAQNVIQIRNQIDGILQKVYDENTLAKKGTLLYKIDDRQLLQQLKINLATLEQSKINLDIALSTLQRNENALNANAISQEEYDNIKLNYENARAKYHTAEANVDSIKLSISYTNITAPIDGVIEKNTYKAGAYVPTNSLLTTIYSTNEAYYVTNTKEAIQGEMMIDNQSALSHTCSPSLDSATGLLSCKFLFANKNNLKNNTTIEAIAKTTSQAMLIPLSSLVQIGDSKAIYIIKDNKAMPLKVQTGDWYEDQVEVIGLDKDTAFVANPVGIKIAQKVEL